MPPAHQHSRCRLVLPQFIFLICGYLSSVLCIVRFRLPQPQFHFNGTQNYEVERKHYTSSYELDSPRAVRQKEVKSGKGTVYWRLKIVWNPHLSVRSAGHPMSKYLVPRNAIILMFKANITREPLISIICTTKLWRTMRTVYCMFWHATSKAGDCAFWIGMATLHHWMTLGRLQYSVYHIAKTLGLV